MRRFILASQTLAVLLFAGATSYEHAPATALARAPLTIDHPRGWRFPRGPGDHARGRVHLTQAPPLQGPVVASWFDDSGGTSCGIHAARGFATLLGIPCGATITMRGPNGRLVRATREDSGPYVSGRTFDLNPGLKAALGCGDLCEVWYRR